MVTINRDGRVVPNNNPESKETKSLRERAIKIEPEYREKLKSAKWITVEFTTTDSPLFDSIARIMGVLGVLIESTPTREVLRRCAHKQTFLSEFFELIQRDLELLPSRLEEKFPHCSKKITNLIDKLKAASQEHNIYLLGQQEQYLLPPESWGELRNYQHFLR